jgi:hypothetical protein
MSAVHNWSGGWLDRAPRADTKWVRFVDRDDRGGYGRWHRGQALTVRSHHRGAGSFFAAINGNVMCRSNGEPKLFRSLDTATAAVEKRAAEGLEVDLMRRSRNAD